MNTNYQPGDIANGHMLSTSGQWLPLPAKRKHTTRNAFIVIGVLVLLMFVGCVALVGGAVDEASKPDTPGSVSQGLGANDATGDVVLGTPEPPDAIGITYLPVTVTNHSAKRSDYYIEVAASDASGNRVGFTNVAVYGLEPGQTSIEQAILSDMPAGATATVLKVQRTSAL